MKTAIIICSLGAMAAAALGLKLGWPDDAQKRYHLAHNEVERIAFREDGTEELRKAVTNERAAGKDLFVIRAVGRDMIWVAVGFSGVAFALSLLALKRQEPPEPTRPFESNGSS